MRLWCVALCAAVVSACFESQTFAPVPKDLDGRRSRLAAVEKKVRKLETERDVEALRDALRDPDYRVRWAAVRRLDALGPDTAACARLGEVLERDASRFVRSWAAKVLERCPATYADALVRALCDAEPAVRLYAWKSIVHMGAQVYPALVAPLGTAGGGGRACAGTSATLRDEVRTRLERMETRALSIVRVGLYHADPQVVRTSIELLGALREKAREALPDLLAVARNADASARVAAVEAVEAIGDLHPFVMPTLWQLAHSEDGAVAEAAADTIDVLRTMARRSASRVRRPGPPPGRGRRSGPRPRR